MNTLKRLTVEGVKPIVARAWISAGISRFNAPFPNLILVLVVAATLSTGCSTTNTIEKRRQERAAAYATFAPETKATVDQGQIKVGMTADAVYIAWGKPSQIIAGESAAGSTTTWLYYGTQLQEVRYWAYRPHYWHDRHYYGAPYLEFDYYPRNYVRAEVTFEKDIVKSWRSLPPPL